ncbi:hypothetical protein [Microbispora sp. GKU 823]|uniref:hypothetical protein n=1 Tax=Microbispora sp. GKU 823 TaxID=1652100 RepID=UPI00117F45FE|nr:hypothetical protein [Microbispora sp. GKU 823]
MSIRPWTSATRSWSRAAWTSLWTPRSRHSPCSCRSVATMPSPMSRQETGAVMSCPGATSAIRRRVAGSPSTAAGPGSTGCSRRRWSQLSAPPRSRTCSEPAMRLAESSAASSAPILSSPHA